MGISALLKWGFAGLILAAAVSLAFASTGSGVRAQTPSSQRVADTVTVTGSATVSLPPDQAQVNGSVQTQADTAASAADQNSQIFQAVINAVQALGISPDNIVTSGFSVSPQYSYTQAQPGEPSQPPTVAGYQASNSVTVTTTQLDQPSRILQAMATAGATNLSGPSYRLQHPEKLQLQAEQQASADALQRAQAIAAGLGVRLGDVLSVNEGGAGSSGFTPAYPAPPPPTAIPRPPIPIAPPPVLPPSSLTASATVTVVFAILNVAGGSVPSGQ
jgi:uncharacterized protein YggE